jgi:D-alanyl-D-alanine carboxypeptidase/D-alanyl-D-alanine-endopeptidase (penicillin-binding protein 4)
VRVAPAGASLLTEVRSAPVSLLLRAQNKPSDNFFAEMLTKGLAVGRGPGRPERASTDPFPTPPTPAPRGAPAAEPAPAPDPPSAATLAAGTRIAKRFAQRLGAAPQLVDGSGLSRADRASPRSVVRLLDRMRARPDFRVFRDSLPIAGRDGTLDHRMRHGAARGRCRAKTGSLIGVSALSGYCATRGGRTVVFSFLMNRVNVLGARKLQDRMANAIARWNG